MNSTSRLRLLCAASALGLLALSGQSVRAQEDNFYSVNKGQSFVQSSSAGAVADPAGAFTFSAQAAKAATLTFPAGTTQALAFVSGDNSFEISQEFSTKTALDAAFPAGTYRLSGTGVPNLSFNLATDTYPVTPAVTAGGTWTNGVLVVNPAVANTITISTFTGYATAGAAGHMEVRVEGTSDSVRIQNQITSVSLGGDPAVTAPLTTINIPAGALTSGRLYQGQVEFDTITTLDTTSVSGGTVVGIFSKSLQFYIAAQTPGTTTPPPVIVAQPANQVGAVGGSVNINLNVTVGGSSNIGNLITNWSFNGQQIDQFSGTKYSPSTTGFGLRINNLTAADAGDYAVTILNAGGSVTSNAATLSLAAATGPVITRQPTSVTVTQGSTATFGVVATGTPAPTYQWRLNGQNVSIGTTGGTGPTISIPGAQATVAGTYTCVVTNVSGTVTSNAATLAIATNFSDPGRLSNLSVLTDITAAVPSFTLGTVVGGAGTSGTKPLVIRAVGPSLGALGVPGTIADPKVDLLTGQTVALTNDNWGGDPGVQTAMASVGAFAFTSPTSKDAAIFGSALASRDYTVSVSGVGGATGNVIAEIYDATPAGTFNATTPRLINVSVLKTINNNGSITLGFTVGGTSAKTILIRAIGPGLAAVGVTSGTVPDPQLTLFNSSSTVIATNNDWSNDQAITVVGGRVNAFAVGNAGAKDAMLLMTLPAGGYTAQASGVGGTGGLIIVEAYEVP